MKKLLYITNIPTPYRQKRFNMMAEVFPKFAIDFEVLYMAKIEPNRQWTISEDSYKYKYKIYKGLHPVIGRFFAHFNPTLLFRLLRNDYDIVVIGGMASPTHWLAPFFISKNKTKIISIESNLNSTVRKSGFGAAIKRLLLSKADAYQVTGTPQKKFINFFYPYAEHKSFIKLPNLIDEEAFRDQVNFLKLNRSILREKFEVDDKTQMWILPAQLIELKGIIPFLNLFQFISNVKLFLLGDGILKETILKYIQQNKLNVVLTGFLQQSAVLEYYAAADLFVLPSFKDSSPLTPIEAIAGGLPILVSSRIGNLEDVLIDNCNGWSYDPILEIEKGKEVINMISKFTPADLINFGKESVNIFNKRFDSVKCLENYAANLKELTIN